VMLDLKAILVTVDYKVCKDRKEAKVFKVQKD